ncbi:MAG: tRNA guanosine(34) transglycosylase Tgt [bacterium]|nr:tRNA guanosine(34) transglycosylase Tgt [bacterium]
MNFSFEIKKKEKRCRARTGIINTPHGIIETPAYSPVATRAVVKALDTSDLKLCNSQVILGNAYHLYLRPGTKIISDFGGFAPFMKWDGPTITDSGGYQVSFLWSKGEKEKRQESEREEGVGRVIKITDEGALFSSHIDGSKHLLTPEKSMEIQKDLGADIIMAFDQPLGLDYSEKKKKEAFERTLKWEERSLIAWKKLNPPAHSGLSSGSKTGGQALFGIVQGGEDREASRKCLKFLLDLNFPGLAIGGESIGKDPKITAKTLDGLADLLPCDKPVHALGLGGGPEGIFEAIERGVDLFDNSSITRMARNGLLLIYPEDGGNTKTKFRLDIAKAKFKEDKKPISKVCKCYTCSNFSKAYLHHLLISKEMTGYRLLSIHNITFINDLMGKMRESINEGSFLSLKKEWI